MKTVLSSREINSPDIWSDWKLSDPEYSDHVVLLSEDSSKFQFIPDRLDDSVHGYGIHF